jgi:hypothetical protein
MDAVLENILIMILTIAVLVGGGYLVLVILGWWLRIKSGTREQDGLAELWASCQVGTPKPESLDDQNP